jgi:hypothetical protein
MVVENVRGAQKWIGRSRWNYGSFHLWGDVPALMPMTKGGIMKPQPYQRRHGTGSWFAIDMASSRAGIKTPEHVNKRNGHRSTAHLTNPAEHIKCGGDWFNGESPSDMRHHSSKSIGRKMATAQIAKIPVPLARHIARTYFPSAKAGNV